VSHLCVVTPRRDTLVTTSATGATRTTGAQEFRRSVDLGPPHFFQKLFLGLTQNFQIQSKNTILVHASNTTFSSSAMLEQAQRDTHDTSRHDSVRVVTQQVEFGIYPAVGELVV